MNKVSPRQYATLTVTLATTALLLAGCCTQTAYRHGAHHHHGARCKTTPLPAVHAAQPLPPVPPKHDIAFVYPPIEVNTIQFALDSAELTPSGRAAIEPIANELRKHPHARVTVHGHTCDLGSADYNDGLGARRAQAVRAHLLAHGAREGQIDIQSHGEHAPKVPNIRELRGENRRAEFGIDIDARF